MSCCQSVCLMFAVHVLKHNHLRFLAHLGSRLKLHLTVSMLMMMPPPELPRRRGNPSVVTKPDAKVIQRDLFKRFHVEKLYQKYRLLQTSTWPSASKLASTIRIEIVRRQGVKWMNEKEKTKWWEVAFWLHRPSYGCFGQAMAASAHGCFSLFESNSYDFKIYGNPSLVHLFVACTNQTCCRYLESSFAQEKKCVDRWLKLFSCCWKTWHCHCRHTHALKFEHTQSDISPMETLALLLVRFICFLLLYSFYKHFLKRSCLLHFF